MVFVNKIVASIALVAFALISNAPQADALSNTPQTHRAVHARAAHGGRLVARPAVQRTEEELERIQRRSTKACRSEEPANNVEKPAKHHSTSATHTHTSTEPSSTPTSGGGGSSGGGKGKKGLGWSHLAGNADITKFITPDVSYVYTWGPECPKGAKGLQCGSMLWGTKMLSQFRASRGSAPILMGMNEVNQVGQADMSVAEGTKMWNNEICKYSKGKFLVSPSTNQAGSGDVWMKEFLSKAACKPDVISVHYYGVQAQGLISKMEQWYQEYKTPLWLTEFACQDYSGQDATCDDPAGFMKTVVEWCEKTKWVHAYFAFGMKKELGHLKPANRLMTAAGNVSPLGNIFLNTLA